jgi:hypothetical protein
MPSSGDSSAFTLRAASHALGIGLDALEHVHQLFDNEGKGGALTRLVARTGQDVAVDLDAFELPL